MSAEAAQRALAGLEPRTRSYIEGLFRAGPFGREAPREIWGGTLGDYVRAAQDIERANQWFREQGYKLPPTLRLEKFIEGMFVRSTEERARFWNPTSRWQMLMESGRKQMQVRAGRRGTRALAEKYGPEAARNIVRKYSGKTPRV